MSRMASITTKKRAKDLHYRDRMNMAMNKITMKDSQMEMMMGMKMDSTKMETRRTASNNTLMKMEM